MRRIFVVEDEAVIALEIQDHLRTLGYEVCGHAVRGEAALQQIPAARPDLVLLDISLGDGISGLDVAERLRAVIDVPVIFLTAYSNPELTERASRSDAYSYLVKPFDPQVLHANIDMALVRHDAAAAVRDSEARFRAFFEQAGVGVAEVDTASWRFLRVNRKCGEILGYSVEELLALGIAGIAHPDDLESDRVRMDRLLSGKLREYTRVRRFLKRDGSTVWAEISVTPLWDTGAAPSRHMAVVKDITEQRQAASALAASEHRLNEAQRVAGTGSWEWDIVADTSTWSENLYVIFGITPEWRAATGSLAFAGLLHPDDHDRVTEALQAAQDAAAAFTVRYRIIRPDGVERYFEDVGEFMVDGSGRPVLMRGSTQDITDRARADAALRASEERYRRLFDDAIEGILRNGPDGTILDVNPSLAHLLGYDSPKELIGTNVLALYADPADRALVLEQAESDTVHDMELKWRKHNGDAMVVQLRGIVVRDEFGQVLHYQDSVRDVTAQHQYDAALRVLSDGLARLSGRSFFEAVAAQVAGIVNADIGFVGSLLTGPVPSMLSLGFAVDGAVRSPMEYALAGTPCEAVVTGQEAIFPNDVQRLFPEDEKLAALKAEAFIAVPLRAISGQVIGVIGIMARRPFSFPARKRAILGLFAQRTAAELERQQAESRFVAVFEFAPDALLIVDDAGSIIQANPAAERLFGYGQDELLRMMVDALVPDELRPGHAQLRTDFDGRVGGRRMGGGNSRLEALRKDGAVIPVEISLSRFGFEGSHLVVAAIRDVSERRTIEQLANRRDRLDALGTLAGGIAHDLNNALGPILMGADILRSHYQDVPDIVDTMEQSAVRAAGMVRQLLMFAKGADGDRSAVQMRLLVGEMEKIISSSFPRNQRLQVRLDRDIPAVRGDATQLHQVLLNLCVNARDAMPDGGILGLEVRTEAVDAVTATQTGNADSKAGTYVVLRVRDTGSGIPAAVLERMFDPFFTTKGPDKGTGLGLSTVLGIVKGHGGFVRVDSELTRGSVFSVYLPADAAAGEPPLASEEPAMFVGRGETVLYVDDEAALRDVATQVLLRLNLTPLTANDGTDGLLQVAQRGAQVQAIITDLHMPHMDGIAFARAARRMLPKVPIIVASGRIEAPAEAELRALGVSGLLNKPFTEKQLAEVLRSVLGEGAFPT